ncbi:MAG: hypothetical protein R3275_00850 [Saprospiraceae bacterium]|nr:hypothetical protein [Saprospiraceae bacterium]
MDELKGLKKRVNHLKTILQNTHDYRKEWKDSLKDTIINSISEMTKAADLDVDIDVRDQIENLETIIVSLGKSNSGISEKLENDLSRPFIRHGGVLVYQQLFNGKILVMINYPYIEGYGEPRPPKNIAIYRPEEVQRPYLIRHLEELVKEVAEWEDYDDDDVNTKKIGFNVDYQPKEDQPN